MKFRELNEFSGSRVVVDKSGKGEKVVEKANIVIHVETEDGLSRSTPRYIPVVLVRDTRMLGYEPESEADKILSGVIRELRSSKTIKTYSPKRKLSLT